MLITIKRHLDSRSENPFTLMKLVVFLRHINGVTAPIGKFLENIELSSKVFTKVLVIIFYVILLKFASLNLPLCVFERIFCYLNYHGAKKYKNRQY